MDPNDLVPPVPDEESVWDAGLNAVYGEDEPSQGADSILGALEERTGASSRR